MTNLIKLKNESFIDLELKKVRKEVICIDISIINIGEVEEIKSFKKKR